MAKKDSESLFPSSFESPEEKKGKKYLLKYAKDLWKAADSQTTSFNFDSRRDRYIRNRKYSEGTQSVEKFKQQFSIDGDSTYLNINWAESTPLPKLTEVMRGQMINQPYKPQFIPVDSLSLTEYDNQKNLIKGKMKVKETFQDEIAKGIVPEPENVPEDNDELEIYMQTTFKLAQTMAMESITNAVLEDNDIEYLNSKLAKDLIDNKIGARRICLDENKNIQVKYIDPVKLVTSFVERDDFKDAKHIGVIDNMTIEDLRVDSQGQLSENDLFDIAKNVAGRYKNPTEVFGDSQYYNSSIDRDAYNKFNVQVLDFEMFSTDEVLLSKIEASNGGKKVIFGEEVKNKKAPRKDKKVKVKNVYCGKWVVGTDYIYDYGLKEHIIRERLNGRYSSNTSLGFIVFAPDIYDMENKSKVEEAIPYAERLIMIGLKFQQFLAKAAPSGYVINVDAVSEALQGMGLGGMKPLDARSIRDQIGDVYVKEFREDGTPLTVSSPIQPLPNGLDQSILILTQTYNETLNQMKEVLGLNDAVDASQPDKKALIGVQKLAVAAHKNALRTLYNAYLKVNEETVRQVSLLAQQLIRKGINKDKFINMVGEEAVKQVNMSRLTMSDFAISIKMLPDEEEKAYIDSKVELALSTQPPLINLQDAFAIRRVANEDVDKAEQLLSVREKKRKKEAQEMSRQMQQENANLQAMVAQAAEQAKLQTVQVERQLDAQLEAQKHQFELERIRVQAEEDRRTEIVKLDGKKELIEAAAEVEDEKMSKDKEESTSYDKIDMPKSSGSRMPSVTPTVPTK